MIKEIHPLNETPIDEVLPILKPIVNMCLHGGKKTDQTTEEGYIQYPDENMLDPETEKALQLS